MIVEMISKRRSTAGAIPVPVVTPESWHALGQSDQVAGAAVSRSALASSHSAEALTRAVTFTQRGSTPAGTGLRCLNVR